MSVLCAHCGQPIKDAASNYLEGEEFNARFFHGDCYRLEYPPEHPEEWPPYPGISRYSHDERVRDGLEQP